ncbi:hypothetical protein GRF29_1536g1392911 [Pseudopithomyces chartarum]|uniref:Beta-galactosidase n=1 Tax=Pseudopithomyces chartarum TaxID=1892770 RepID=A0AAN6LQC8_9PLEO|nr:hypothetical protein GRF29_1536g1392911 [Pseudopithomyces chartarum]
MHVTNLLKSWIALSQLGFTSASSVRTTKVENPAFTYNATHFLLSGNTYQIIGGQMDPQRIPPPFWRDRLKKVRAMGLNTIFTYTFWNLLEPVQGSWDDNEGKGIASFFRIAQEEGLHIVLRPGPYICGEREWGGFPAWLSTVPDLVVRANNVAFLNASKSYLTNLSNALRGLHVHEGGPILMVQVENEYGSYGEDHAYTAAVRDILRETFGDVMLYTNDGTEQWTLEGGSVPGVLAEVDGDPRAGFAALRKYITDPSMKGPLLDGEYYTWTFDSWGYNRSTPNIQGFVNDVEYVLGNESAGISLYMVHGGTNFGFGNGALWQGKTRAFTTSYDYGAPIDEAGRTTELYWRLRGAIKKFVPEGSVPDVPGDVPLGEIPTFELRPVARLFDTQAVKFKTRSERPLAMEELEQSYGFTLYEHVATSSSGGLLRTGDRPRDRVIVYLNGIFQGVLDSTYAYPQNISVALTTGTKLQFLVENLGRVDYYSRGTVFENMVLDPHKGIVGDVTIGNSTIRDWDHYSIQLDSLPDLSTVSGYSAGLRNSTQPVFYTGQFAIQKEENNTAALDTYLAIESGIKGNVWVNGFHLGRYWRVGPQQSLYLPGSVLYQGENEIVVLELEPGHLEGNMKATGLSERVWAVEEDVDCSGCI